MKKIIKLTESDLLKIVKRILSEESDQENTVNYLLDKINRYGMDSLTDDELDMLKDTESIEYSMEDSGSDEMHGLVKLLQKLKLVNPKYVNIYDDEIEVYNLEGETFDYFSQYDGYLKMYLFELDDDEDFDSILTISFEDDADIDDDLYNDTDDVVEARNQVINYISDKWPALLENHRIGVDFEED